MFSFHLMIAYMLGYIPSKSRIIFNVKNNVMRVSPGKQNYLNNNSFCTCFYILFYD